MPNRQDQVGRRRSKGSRHKTEAPFAQLPLRLLASVPMGALSLAARRILDRLVIEHIQGRPDLDSGDGGFGENGKLKVTYDQLATWSGIAENQVSLALAELVDLGIIVIVKEDMPHSSVKKPHNLYRLTFVPDNKDAPPTNEWKRWDPSDWKDPKARAAAMKRARKAAANARARIAQGQPLVRTEAAVDGAVAAAEAALAKVGKGERVGRPGNKQTRSALNAVNASSKAVFDGTPHTVSSISTPRVHLMERRPGKPLAEAEPTR